MMSKRVSQRGSSLQWKLKVTAYYLFFFFLLYNETIKENSKDRVLISLHMVMDL